jgi:hypothetical protein
VGENRFVGQEKELFFLPHHEAKALPCGNDHSLSLHRSIWSNGVMEYWVEKKLIAK